MVHFIIMHAQDAVFFYCIAIFIKKYLSNKTNEKWIDPPSSLPPEVRRINKWSWRVVLLQHADEISSSVGSVQWSHYSALLEVFRSAKIWKNRERQWVLWLKLNSPPTLVGKGGVNIFFLNTYSTVKKLWFQNSTEQKITGSINAISRPVIFTEV